MPNYQNEIFRLRRQAVGNVETFREQMAVYLKQLGELGQSAYYMDSFPTEYNVHKVSARKALEDLATQIQMSCAILGFDFDDVVTNGFISFRDKMREVVRAKQEGREWRSLT